MQWRAMFVSAAGGRNGGRCREGVINHSLTQMGAGAGLTSLREGRRHSAAGLGRPRVPAIVEIHPRHHDGEVGWCWQLSNIRRVTVCTYKRGLLLVMHVIRYKTYYLPFKRPLGPGTDAGVDGRGGGGG